MATRPLPKDYQVLLNELDPGLAAEALGRVHGQLVQSVKAQQPMIFVHHSDLTYIVVMAALWAQESR